jgi:hypothetical protein
VSKTMNASPAWAKRMLMNGLKGQFPLQPYRNVS